MKPIAIIGAGVTGVTTEFVLCQLRYKGSVFEKQKYSSIWLFMPMGENFQQAMQKFGNTLRTF